MKFHTTQFEKLHGAAWKEEFSPPAELNFSLDDASDTGSSLDSSTALRFEGVITGELTACSSCRSRTRSLSP